MDEDNLAGGRSLSEIGSNSAEAMEVASLNVSQKDPRQTRSLLLQTKQRLEHLKKRTKNSNKLLFVKRGNSSEGAFVGRSEPGPPRGSPNGF